MAIRSTGANYLLNKDDVGKSKPSTRDLPEGPHAYGKPDVKDPEGVAEVTRSWQFHNPSYQPKPDTDFKKLNKLSIASKAITARDTHQFKKAHEVTMKQKDIVMEKPKVLPPTDFAYGMPMKPSTPIKKVILHGYAEEGEDDQMKKTKMYEKINKKEPLPGPKPTKASKKVFEATKQKHEEKKKNDFKLGRFKNVTSKINTQNNALKTATTKQPTEAIVDKKEEPIEEPKQEEEAKEPQSLEI